MHLGITSHLKNRAYWSWLDNWTSAGLVLVTYVAWGGWCACAYEWGRAGRMCSWHAIIWSVYGRGSNTGHAQGTRDGSRGPKWITQSNDKSDGLYIPNSQIWAVI